MIGDVRRHTAKIAERFKHRFYGRTFRCPVCHLELALVDVNGNRLMVCPVCGVVLDVEEVYGHAVPVVMEVEAYRPQPKMRIHPLATHIPIGLYPFAVLGAMALLLISFLGPVLPGLAPFLDRASVLADATFVLLVLSVGLSIVTFVSGLRDWYRRYRRRPYAQIRLKIAFSVVFLVLGGLAIALHASGAGFSSATGLVDLGSPLAIVLAAAEVVVLGAGLVVIATLGHVGGTLVFGR
jgi:transcription elongation factor Elf1